MTEQIRPGSRGQRISATLVAGGLSFATSAGIGLVLVPFYLKRLGPELYGLVPLANSIVQYLGLLVIGINYGVGRLVCVAVERSRLEEARSLFSTAVLLSGLLAVLVLVIGAVVTTFLPHLVNLPLASEADARWMFGLAFVAFGVTSWSTPLGVPAYCKERLDLRHWIDLGGKLLRAALIVVLFLFVGSKLWIVGLGNLALAGVALGGAFWIRGHLMPGLRWERQLCNRRSARELLSVGQWTILNTVGSLLLLQVDLIVINRLLGPTATGEYGALLQLVVILRGLASTIASSFAPSIVNAYAAGDGAAVSRIVRASMKMIAMVVGLPATILAVSAPNFLRLWLGVDHADLAPVLVLLVAHLPLSQAGLALFPAHLAYDRLRVPSLLTLGLGALNVLGLFLLVEHLGLVGAAMAGMGFLALKNVVLLPVYTGRIVSGRSVEFLTCLGRILLRTMLVATVGAFIFARMTGDSLLGYMLGVLGCVVVDLVALRFILLDAEERLWMLGRLRSMFAGLVGAWRSKGGEDDD